MAEDYLVKAVAENGMFRTYAVNATQLVTKAQEIHDTWSAASAALGRTLIGTLLLATSGLQGEAGMTVKIQGTGAVGTQGTLSVTKMTPGDKTPYTGEVNLVSGELGDDFTYYLAQSEQIPSAVGLSVFVEKDDSIDVAGGFMVQVLPGAKDEQIADLEKSIKELPLVSEMLRDGDTPEDILKKIFAGKELKILDKMPVKYECNCSKERFAKALASVKKSDLEEMIAKDHGAEAVCQFCGKKYEFSEDELKAMLKDKD